MKVAVYLSGIPRKSKNEQKKQTLRSFAQGVEAVGDRVVVVEDNRIVECDVAVIQGYVHNNSKQAPHLLIRKSAIDHQKDQGKHALIIDSNLYQCLDMQHINKYLRYSVGGIFANTAWYFDQNRDLNRWNTIRKSYNYQVQDRNPNSNEILVCLQRNGGWSMDGRSSIEWATETINKLRLHTDKPIIVRGHPGDLNTVTGFNVTQWKNVSLQMSSDILISEQLKKTWATVTYNSSPGVASLLHGVPVFVTDPQPQRSQCWPLCSTNLATVNDVEMSDREDFFHRLAQCHWSESEVYIGDAWRFMRERLPNP